MRDWCSTHKGLMFSTRDYPVPVHELYDGTLVMEANHFHHVPKPVPVQTRWVGDHNFIQLTKFCL